MPNNYLELFLSILAGSGAALLLVLFLAKKLINQLLTKELENHKTLLTEKTEILKSNMAMFAHEQNTSYSRIDSQRAQAVNSVYAALRAIINPSARIAAGYPVVNASLNDEIEFYREHAESTHSERRVFCNTLADHAIYFPVETYEKIATLSTSIGQMNATFLRPIRQGKAEGWPSSKLHKEITDKQKLYENEYQEIISPELKELTNLFRAELGIHKTKNQYASL